MSAAPGLRILSLVMSSRPTVVASFAQTLDGKIAGPDGSSRWISGSETLDLAHRLRGENDAILVGIRTVLADDPELSCRIDGYDSPLRVILDSGLRLPLDSRIVRTAERYRTLVLTADAEQGAASPGSAAPEERSGADARQAARQALVNRSIEVASCTKNGDILDPVEVLSRLSERRTESLFIEGGNRVLSSFLRAGLIDRLVVVIAPMVLGGGVPAFSELGAQTLADAARLHSVSTKMMGNDLVWELTRE